jgi:hypothetical protein
MADKFDAYYKWFGIRPAEQPPDCYRLLGLQKFESDADVISNAADQRMAHLRTMQNGPQRAESQRILNEVSAARVQLLDSEKKLAYDLALRKKIAAESLAANQQREAMLAPARPATARSTTTAPNGARWKGQASVAPLDAGDGLAPAATLSGELRAVGGLDLDELDRTVRTTAAPSTARRPRAKRGGSPVVRAMVLSVMLAALVGGGYAVLHATAGFDPLKLFGKGDDPSLAATEKSASGSLAAPANSPSEHAPGEPDRPTAQTDRPMKPHAPTKGAPQESSEGARPRQKPHDPAPPGNSKNGAAPSLVNVFDKFPRDCELPAASDLSAHKLATFVGASPAPVEQLALVAHAAALDAGEAFEMGREPNAQRWYVRMASPENAAAVDIAMIWVDGLSLEFQWQAGAAAAPHAAQLCNCLLRVRADAKNSLLALRKPVVAPAYLVDLSKQADLKDLKIAVPPKAEAVTLEVGPVVDFPVAATFKYDRRVVPFPKAGGKEDVVLALAALNASDQPEIHWQPITTRNGLQIKVTPQLATQKGTIPLTRARVDEIRKNAMIRKVRLDKTWNDLRDRGQALEKQRAAVLKRYAGSGAAQAAKDKEVARLNAQIGVIKPDFDKVDGEKIEVDGILAAAPAVDDLVGRLHKAAKIPYRVYATADGVQFDLVRGVE